MMSSIYEDRYRKTDNGWRICFTKSTPRTIVDGCLQEDGLIQNGMKIHKEEKWIKA